MARMIHCLVATFLFVGCNAVKQTSVLPQKGIEAQDGSNNLVFGNAPPETTNPERSTPRSSNSRPAPDNDVDGPSKSTAPETPKNTAEESKEGEEGEEGEEGKENAEASNPPKENEPPKKETRDPVECAEGAQCDDGNSCTVSDACVDGQCVGTVKTCNDNNPCTKDACVAGGCVHTAQTGACNDGNSCTLYDVCQAKKCKGTPIVCNDGNFCTNDSCNNGSCVYTNNWKSCDDGDPCTYNGKCTAGKCVTKTIDCEDNNSCTNDSCKNGSCVYANKSMTCNDGDPCTSNDYCKAGQCQGKKLSCNDNNPCTQDYCIAGGCKNILTNNDACGLKLTVTEPQRGAVVSNKWVWVKGKVESPGANVKVTVNGAKTYPKSDGSFSYLYKAQPGVNILKVAATNDFDQSDKAVQSFIYGESFMAPGTMSNINYVNNAAAIWLDDTVFDDQDTADLDDMATMATWLLEEFDINSAIPNPLPIQPKIGWCKWTIEVTNIQYAVGSVDLKPTTGGVEFFLVVNDMSAWVSAVAGGGCPDAKGWIYIDTVTVAAGLTVEADGSGKIDVKLQEVDVNVADVNVDIKEGFASIFNMVINWFEDDLAKTLASQLEAWIPKYLSPMLEGVLDGMTVITKTMSVPSMAALGLPVTVKMKAMPKTAVLSSQGAEFGLAMGVAAYKSNVPSLPGSLVRGNCGKSSGSGGPKSCVGNCGAKASSGCWCDELCANYGDCCSDKGSACGGVNPSILPHTSQVEAYVHEDFLNQFLFALWRAGHTKMTLSQSDLSGYLGNMALSNVQIKTTPLLPPIVTSCTDSGYLELQVGDMKMDVNFKSGGMPLTITMYASFKVRVVVTLKKDGPGPNKLLVSIIAVDNFGVDVVGSNSSLPISDDLFNAMVEALVTEAAVDFFVNDLIKNLNMAFPMPQIEVGKLIPMIPSNKKATFNPVTVSLKDGHLVIGGKIQ